jgi:hypothetical protein
MNTNNGLSLAHPTEKVLEKLPTGDKATIVVER